MTEQMAEYGELLEAVNVARRKRDEAKLRESEARREATGCENALQQAEKAFVDYLVAQHPTMVDQIAKRRRN